MALYFQRHGSQGQDSRHLSTDISGSIVSSDAAKNAV